MKTTGQCFKAFVEFPILPFDPAIFGFTKDVSRSSSPAGCPSFATEDDAYRLWLNWPEVAEREWYADWSRYFITHRDENGGHDPISREPILVFKTQNLPELVRHLLVHRYDPKLDNNDLSEAHAEQWFCALKSAGVSIRFTNEATPEIQSNLRLNPAEWKVLWEVLDRLSMRYGDRLKEIVAKAV